MATIGPALLDGRRPAHSAPGSSARFADELARIETQSGGRLGVATLDTRTGIESTHRRDERFPMCSTFKLLAAAAVLARVDAGQERLDQRVHFEAADLVEYSPVTKDRVGAAGMTLEEICAAAVTLSDNTAGNLLLARLGGPAGLTDYARSLGDSITRLDRIEPHLNEATPGDPRDTTTPAAMTGNLHRLLIGDALSEKSRTRLTGWLIGNKVGDTRLRAGVPPGWRVGDKTGTGEHGATNDVGILWPSGRAPVLVSVYLTETTVAAAQRNASIAAVARALASALDG